MQNDGRLIRRGSLLWPPGFDIGSAVKKSAGPPVGNSLERLKKQIWL